MSHCNIYNENGYPYFWEKKEMTYTLRFLPELEEDVIAGYAWYEGKVPQLGEEFLRMFYACVGGIPRNPLHWN